MSAWMCSSEHIGGLARAVVEQVGAIDDDGKRSIWGPAITPDEKQVAFVKIATRLERANRDSIAARYGPSSVKEQCGPRIKWRDMSTYPELTPPQIVKLAHCLDYQSCETRTWRKSKAYRDICALVFNATYNYPGTEEVPWGI